AHRRCDPGGRDLCRPICVRRQNRNLPWPLGLRSRTALGGLGGGPARLRVAAASASRRYHADPRQRPLAGRRLDLEYRAQTCRRPPRRRAGAPRHLAIVAGAVSARRYRRQILPALAARTGARNPLSALHAVGRRWRGTAPGADRVVLRLALPRQPGRTHPRRHAQALRRTAAANTPRWRPYLAQSRRADRALDRPV